MFKTAPLFVRLFLKSFGYRGVTLPPWGIFLLEDSFNDQSLRRHEAVHWEQYKQRGALKFYAGYIWLLLRHGYKNHPWEQEARAKE